MTITTEDRLRVLFEPTTPVPADPAPDAAAGDEQRAGSSPRPTFTITEAAAACAVSRKTITRKLADLAEFGAAKDVDGVWHIPVEALLALGLHPGRSLPAGNRAAMRPTGMREVPAAPPSAPAGDTVTIPRERYDDLRIRLARAEAEAAERALALADARLALRALTAGPSSPARTVVADPGGPHPVDRDPASGPSRLAPPAGGLEPPRVRTAASAAPGPHAEDSQPAGAVEAAVGAGDPGLVSARNQAAQRGGYVPAAGAPARKRRWWHSSQR